MKQSLLNIIFVWFPTGFFEAVSRLVRNTTYMACVLGVCADLASFMGYFTFAAKYIETQFGVSPSFAPMILGKWYIICGIISQQDSCAPAWPVRCAVHFQSFLFLWEFSNFQVLYPNPPTGMWSQKCFMYKIILDVPVLYDFFPIKFIIL